MNYINVIGELEQRKVDDIYKKYVNVVNPVYKTPNEILIELKKDHKLEEDITAKGILKRNFYDSKSVGNKHIESKLFSVDNTNTRIYVNYTDELIQVDGDQKIADKIIILRGLKQSEIENKLLFYHFITIMMKYNLLKS